MSQEIIEPKSQYSFANVNINILMKIIIQKFKREYSLWFVNTII